MLAYIANEFPPWMLAGNADVDVSSYFDVDAFLWILMLSFMNLDAIFYESWCWYMYKKYVLLLYLKHKNLFIRESLNILYYKMVLATYISCQK